MATPAEGTNITLPGEPSLRSILSTNGRRAIEFVVNWLDLLSAPTPFVRSMRISLPCRECGPREGTPLDVRAKAQSSRAPPGSQALPEI